MTDDSLLPDVARRPAIGILADRARHVAKRFLTIPRLRRRRPAPETPPEAPTPAVTPAAERPAGNALDVRSATREFLDALASTQHLSADRATYVERIVREHQVRGQSITAAELVIQFGFVSAGRVLDLIQERNLQMPLPADAAWLYSLWPASLLAQMGVQPIRLHKSTLYLAALRPLQRFENDALIRRAAAASVTIDRIVQEPQDTVTTLAGIYSTPHTTGQQFIDLLARHDIAAEPEQLGPALDSLFSDALEHGASDIHLEIHDNLSETRIEYRLANTLVHRANITPRLGRRLATLIRERARIDTSNIESPFDSDFRFEFHGRPIDIRVAVLPTFAGQKLTLRLSDPTAFQTLREIFGHFPELADRLEEESSSATRRGSFGLVTGPTNQGKSTTLRAYTMNIPRHRLRVMEIGDPIEVKTPLTTQTHVNRHDDIGLTFDRYLRGVLRHDPDVVFAQELRDPETVNAAFRIIETGHKVLATLHADSDIDTLPRLFSQVPERRNEAAFIVSKFLSWIIHQRLVDTPCPSCSTAVGADVLPEHAFELLGAEDSDSFVSLSAAGCDHCLHLGVHGRTAVPSVIWFGAAARTPLLHRLTGILSGADVADYTALLDLPGIEHLPRSAGLRTLSKRRVIAWQTAVFETEREQSHAR
ncbi:MAG: ATPase, T2SS/T4P/T4SS family [Parvibaculum sp.]